MKTIEASQIRRRKRRIKQRLARSGRHDRGRPLLAGRNVRYELARKTGGTAFGGIAAIHAFVQRIGLPEAIDEHLHMLGKHAPYHESDHVLNLAYNALCGAEAIQDIEQRRGDEHFLDSIGAERIPDPTTAGDFCRRFRPENLDQLQRSFDAVRVKIWQQQDATFLQQAIIDMDGTIVATGGECKAGADNSYKNIWGYHPLVLTLAQSGEVLRLINRGGNSHSARGAAEQVDQVIELCQSAGFRGILLRGDTAFSQCERLDGWNERGIKFVFGFPARKSLIELAENQPESAWQPLARLPRIGPGEEQRTRPAKVKLQTVAERGYSNRRMDQEWVLEMPYRPQDCQETYRLVVVRKKLNITKQGLLFEDYEHFFYLSNLELSHASALQILEHSHRRCNQENVIAQLNRCRALHAPVDNLLSNWAYMLMTSLGWTLKAWVGLSIPVDGRWKEQHQQERQIVLAMEHRTFVDQFIRLPAQIIRQARQLTVRLLSVTANLHLFNRWLRVALK